jgi:hypothetical protein
MTPSADLQRISSECCDRGPGYKNGARSAGYLDDIQACLPRLPLAFESTMKTLTALH